MAESLPVPTSSPRGRVARYPTKHCYRCLNLLGVKVETYTKTPGAWCLCFDCLKTLSLGPFRPR